MVSTIQDCGMCRGNGYFGDFQLGFYPMPCSNCIGSGKEYDFSDELREKMREILVSSHKKISDETERLNFASNLLGEGVKATLYFQGGRIPAEEYVRIREEQKAKGNDLYGLTGKFSPDYIEVEKKEINNTWEQTIELTSSYNFHPHVKKTMSRVIGKSLREIIHMEQMDIAKKGRPFE